MALGKSWLKCVRLISLVEFVSTVKFQVVQKSESDVEDILFWIEIPKNTAIRGVVLM